MRALLIAAAACLVLAAPASAASTTLVINEVDYDQPMTDTAEFLELKNVSSAAINLDPYSLEFVNGNAGGAAVYRTFELPDFALAAGDHYVVCANPANTPNCDLDVAPETDLIQNGAPDALGLRLGMTLVDAVSYEGDTGAPYTEGSGAGTDDADGRASRAARTAATPTVTTSTSSSGRSRPAPPTAARRRRAVRRVRRRRGDADPRHPGQRRREPRTRRPVRHRGRRRRRLPGFGGPGRLLRPGGATPTSMRIRTRRRACSWQAEARSTPATSSASRGLRSSPSAGRSSSA